jgi:endonuclease-3
VPRESKAARAERARRIAKGLFEAHPDAHCELHHRNPYQLLVATILSAQSTDKMVNSVTPQLFRRYPDARKLAAARTEDVEQLVHATGFFRQKSRTLVKLAGALVERHGGQVPATLEELVELPGVGRKTANLILGNCFDVPGIVVDTHVQRLAQRMGLTRERDPAKIERDLMELVPQPDWTRFSHAMIFHGRRTCFARSPECEGCPLYADCPFPRQRRPRPARKTGAHAAGAGRRAR